MIKTIMRHNAGKITVGFFMVLLMVLLFGNSLTVQAYDEKAEIEVKIGFVQEETYSKGKVTKDELAARYGVYSAIYTWIDKRPAAGTTEATGIYMSNILEYFNIKRRDVHTYFFRTLDDSGELKPESGYSDNKLFATRYSFVNNYQRVVDDYNAYMKTGTSNGYLSDPFCYRLSHFYNMADNSMVPTYSESVWETRQEVVPMLAYSKWNTRWDNTKKTDSYPASLLDHKEEQERDGFTLFYGQNSISDQNRGSMAKMVHEIVVWYEKSTLSITVDKSSLEGKEGESGKLRYLVHTPDPILDQAVINQLEWRVDDNTGVASVNENGEVTFNKTGSTTISLYYKNSSYGNPIKVTVNGEEKETETDENGAGGGSGGGSGGGHGIGTGTGTGSGSGSGIGSDVGSGTTDINGFLQNPDLYIASAGGGGGGEGDAVDTTASFVLPGEIINEPEGEWKLYEMAADTQLLNKKQSNPLVKGISYIILAFFVLGIAEEALRFYLQVKPSKKLKIKSE